MEEGEGGNLFSYPLAEPGPMPIPFDSKPMEAEPVDELPGGPGWLFEPKYDGFRCIAFRDGDKVDLQSKNQKPLDRYFPEIVVGLAPLKADVLSSTARSSSPASLRDAAAAAASGGEPSRRTVGQVSRRGWSCSICWPTAAAR